MTKEEFYDRALLRIYKTKILGLVLLALYSLTHPGNDIAHLPKPTVM
jgi:hypothetical protein